jgi:ADP-heptose:LPS heptosyltransferase
MAPAGPGAALVGPGPTEVASVLRWDSPEAAALLADDAPLSSGLSALLASFDAAVVYSRSAVLVERLRMIVPRVVACDPQPPGDRHAAEWYLGALHALGVPAQLGPLPPLEPTPEEHAAAARVLGALRHRFLALHPGSGSPAKNWAAEPFAAVANALAPARAYALIEGPADREAVERVHALAPQGVRLRSLPLRTLGAVLTRALLYVGNDSGVSHLAAAYGASCLVAFGPTDPIVWAPLGPRVATLRF